jgi:hypothetical protein
VPNFPKPAAAILSDIVFGPHEIQPEAGLVVRSVYEPETGTLTVQVLTALVPIPVLIAHRVILIHQPPEPEPDFNGDNTWERDDRPDE